MGHKPKSGSKVAALIILQFIFWMYQNQNNIENIELK
jgi:hypothetical protein